jgi:hypothetical protein
MRQLWYILIACVGCLLLGGLAWFIISIWQFNQPPFPLTKLDTLHSGLSTNQVQEILGIPSSSWIRTNKVGAVYAEWAYSRDGSWPIVYIYFSPEGTFERHVYDY